MCFACVLLTNYWAGRTPELKQHAFRHTWRTAARRAGVDLRTSSELGGWSRGDSVDIVYEERAVSTGAGEGLRLVQGSEVLGRVEGRTSHETAPPALRKICR